MMSGVTVTKIRIVVILFYAFVIVGLALYDEKPSPELARDTAQPSPGIIEPGNAWLVFLGFSAPEGVSPYSYGEEKMRKVQNALRTGKNVKKVVEEVNEDSTSELSFQGEIPSFSRTEYCGMSAYAAAHEEVITALLSRNEELLRRYELLRSCTRYTEPIGYGAYGPIPSFLPVKRAAQARMFQLAAMIGSGKVEEALAGAREEVEFWRLIARSSMTLISKMVALAILKHELRFAGDLAACRRLNANELAKVRHILRPFDKGEVELVASLRGESRYMRNSVACILGLNRDSWLPVAMMCKPNATGNRICEHMQSAIRLAEMTPQEFLEKAKEQEDSNRSRREIGIPFLYNPLGEIFTHPLQEFGPFLQQYIAVGHNLEGIRRLLLLKVSAVAENFPAERMQQFLDANKEELGNPFTGAPMSWDPAGSIFFMDPFGTRIGEAVPRSQVD